MTLETLAVELVGEIADLLPDIKMVAQLRLVSHAVKEGVDAGSRRWRTAQEVRDAGGVAFVLKNRRATLEFAAARGLMGVIRRMHPNHNEVVTTLLFSACASGRVDVVRKLRLDYELRGDDVRSFNNWKLRLACENGHVDVVRELRLGYGLTADDARAQNNGVLTSDCRNGHFEMVRELHEGYGLTGDVDRI